MLFPVDLTLGVSPNTLPWANLAWLLIMFVCEYGALYGAVRDLPVSPTKLSSADVWLSRFTRAQAVLSMVAVTCHLLSFLSVDWRKLQTSPLVLLFIFNGMGSLALYYLYDTPGIAREEIEKQREKKTDGDSSPAVEVEEKANSTTSSDHPEVKTVHDTANPASWGMKLPAVTAKQWRLLSVMIVLAGFYTFVTVGWQPVFNFVAAACVVGTAIVFLACTTALCRDAVSEQCAEFAVAAAGMVISTATYWPAAGIVSNVVVGAAAVHMALSLTCGLPRPTVKCSLPSSD